MPKITLSQWIKENRQEIDEVLSTAIDPPKNDLQRKQWIIEDDNLSNWARSEGVKIPH